MITIDQLNRFANIKNQDLVDAINAVMQRYEINTSRRINHFMTQACFETQSFTKFEENLYYSTPERLVAVWPHRFTCDKASCSSTMVYAPDYIKSPQKLASLVYANRNGNGDVASGDGWNFRGRGGFHLTFLDNYLQYSKDVYGDDRCVENPDMVGQPADAMMSAGWFWGVHRLNELADADMLTKITEVVNGSAATVPARLQVLNKANQVF